MPRRRLLNKKGDDLLDLDADGSGFGQGDVISWQVRTENDSFDYAAIKCRPITAQLDNSTYWLWYITGAGLFYQGNEVTSAQLMNILHEDEVTGVWFNTGWAAALVEE